MLSKITIPFIRKIIPSVIASELVSVQPLTGPVGEIFSIRHNLELYFGPGTNQAMMNIRQRSVNVNRLELLEKLRANLAVHRAEYETALSEYKQRLIDDLKLAVKKVGKVENPLELKSFRFALPFPQDYSSQYEEVIDMLEMSVDENINLDSESFKAYLKNEWSWKGNFEASAAMYKSVGSSLSL
jgi:hypothetical protein